jgi:hypothetical protein
MVRLLSFRLPQILKYWRNGLLLSSGFETVFVEFHPAQNVLSVTIRAEDRAHAEDCSPAGQPHNRVALPLSPSEIDQYEEEKQQQMANIEEKPKRKKSSKKEKKEEKNDEKLKTTTKKKKKKSRREKPSIETESEDVTSNGSSSAGVETGMPSFQLLSLLVFSTVDALVRDWFKVRSIMCDITRLCAHGLTSVSVCSCSLAWRSRYRVRTVSPPTCQIRPRSRSPSYSARCSSPRTPTSCARTWASSVRAPSPPSLSLAFIRPC